jgi:hypothetical protein
VIQSAFGLVTDQLEVSWIKPDCFDGLEELVPLPLF